MMTAHPKYKNAKAFQVEKCNKVNQSISATFVTIHAIIIHDLNASTLVLKKLN